MNYFIDRNLASVVGQGDFMKNFRNEKKKFTDIFIKMEEFGIILHFLDKFFC